MDTLSRGVHFYLPGYDVEQHVSPFFSNRQDKWKNEMEEREFEDSHLREFHTEVIAARVWVGFLLTKQNLRTL